MDWDKYTNQNIVYVPYGITKRYMRKARDTIVGLTDRSLAARIRRKLKISVRNYLRRVGI